MPPKHDSANATQKILALFSLLMFSKREYSLKELALVLQCSRQTILRLVDQIEEVHSLKVEKTFRQGQNYYKALVPNQNTNISLSQEELQQLLFCRDCVQHLLPESQKQLLLSATHKAEFLSNTTETLPQVAHTNVKGIVDYSSFEDMLETITIAIRTHEVVEIEYLAKEKKEAKPHALVPVRIVAYNDCLYLRAWKVTEKGKVSIINPITFAIHRIHKLWTTNRAMPIEEFNKTPFSESFEAQSKVFGIAMQTKPFPVEIRFVPPATTYIKERVWSADQEIILHKHEDSLILKMTAQSEMEVIKWVLGFGAEAELISPMHLRKKVARELDLAMMKYE